MKIFINIKVFMSLIILVVTISLIYSLPVSAAGTNRDCDDNAVIRCGINSPAELKNKYHDRYVRNVFNYFGVDDNDIDKVAQTMQLGKVTKSGDIYIKDKHVATNAITVGRQNIPGSKTVVYKNQTFYTRPTRISFLSSPQEAYVVMKNNRFSYAVLTGCGNPVAAKPIIRSTKKTAPPVTVNIISPPPPPVVLNSNTTINNIHSPPPPTPVLPKTGADSLLLISTTSSLVGGISHYVYKRRKFTN